MTTKTLAIAAWTVLTLPLGASALDVRSGHDASVDFTALEHYRWVEGTPAQPAEVQRAIEGTVRSHLEASGLTESSETPNLWVVTHAAADGRLQVDASSHGYGYRWRSWGPTSVNFRDVDPGTLVVDLVDAETKELVWRGIAVDAFNPKAKKTEKNEKNISKAAEKLFASFPPQE